MLDNHVTEVVNKIIELMRKYKNELELNEELGFEESTYTSQYLYQQIDDYLGLFIEDRTYRDTIIDYHQLIDTASEHKLKDFLMAEFEDALTMKIEFIKLKYE